MKKISTKLKKLLFAFRYRWVGKEFFFVTLKVINNALNLHFYSDEKFRKDVNNCFNKKWLKQNGEQLVYDFKGIKMPFVDKNTAVSSLKQIFDDVFLIPCYFDDNHHKDIVEKIDFYVAEGPYGYVDGNFDVSINSGDVVLDLGAWYGDFSAYAASKGATVYAFEPEKENFDILFRTKRLNPNGEIIPIQLGVSNHSGETEIFINGSLSHSILSISESTKKETITLTTIDQFVMENNIQKVTFIKSDIEGEERNMLIGATETLKRFAPKLALCTYHYPDDAEVMTKIILNANPNYTIKYLRHKMFAAVI